MGVWSKALLLLLLLKLSTAIFVPLPACEGRCFHHFNKAWPCQCNIPCEAHNDCYSDFFSLCKPGAILLGSCAGKCGIHYDSSRGCQCNSRCSHYGNCCSDYADVCPHGQVTQNTAEPETTEIPPYDMN